jgi:hypothetical protein
LQGLVEGLAARMGERVDEIESRAVEQVEQRIGPLVALQSEMLERRAMEVAAGRQAALEEDVRQYLASQEEAALLRQESLIGETFRTMSEGMEQTTKATSERLKQQADEISLAARTNLWQNVQQELPAIERNVFARSRAQADQALTACLDELNQQLPKRVQEAEQSLKQQVDSLVEERLNQIAAGLAARAEQVQAESRARIEQQVQEVWKQASQAFLRHIVSELNQRKRGFLEETEGGLKELAAQNLAATRRSAAELLKSLGASFLEEACRAERGPATNEDQKDPREITSVIEAPVEGAHVGA